MRSRTIRFRKETIELYPDPVEPKRLAMRVMARWHDARVSMPRGAIEKLRNALNDWLESGDA